MYKFDKNDLKAISKRTNRRAFKFSDYIPNSMQPKRPDSRVSLSQTQMLTPQRNAMVDVKRAKYGTTSE